MVSDMRTKDVRAIQEFGKFIHAYAAYERNRLALYREAAKEAEADVYKRQPFLSDKYDITKHPKYKMLSDYDKRNAFDIEKYRSHKLVVKPTQTFDLYDMGEVEAD